MKAAIQVYKGLSSDDVLGSVLDSVSDGTRPVYEGTILAYRRWVNDNPYPTIYASLMAFRKELEQTNSPTTVNRKLSALRKFCKVANTMGGSARRGLPTGGEYP